MSQRVQWWLSCSVAVASMIGTSIAAPPNIEVAEGLRARWAEAQTRAPQAVQAWMAGERARADREVPGRWLGYRKSAGYDGASDAIYCTFGLNEQGASIPGLCISADDQTPRTLSEAVRRQRAQIWETRGVASPQMQAQLDQAQDDEVLKVLVWAKTVEVDREAIMAGRVRATDLRAEQARHRADVHALCAAAEGCEVYEVGGPMLMVKAPASSLRPMRHAHGLAVMEPWPTEKSGSESEHHYSFEAMHFDYAQLLSGANGAGVNVAVFEGGRPRPSPGPVEAAFAGHWDPADIYCPSAPEGTHGQTVMSIIGANHSYGTAGDQADAADYPASLAWTGRRDLDGSAPGARILHGSLSSDCNYDGIACLTDQNCFLNAPGSAGCDTTISRCKRNQCADDGDCPGTQECEEGEAICRLPDLEGISMAASWAASYGSKVVYNYSRGAPQPCLTNPTNAYDATSRFFDWLAINPPFPVVVASTGNKGFRRTVSSTNHNGIVVGASLAHWTKLRADDTMWYEGDCRVVNTNGFWTWFTEDASAVGSQSRNPGLLELPHVVAAARSMTLPWLWKDQWRESGPATSWAAPKVSGLAASLMDASLGSHTNTFAFWPEAVKAIILATATTDVDGYELDLTDGHDDQDGAGEISAFFAAELVKNGAFNSWDSAEEDQGVNLGSFSASSFGANGKLPQVVLTGPVSATTVQVAMAWNVDPGCSGVTACVGTDKPTANLAFRIELWRKLVPGAWMLVDETTSPDPSHNHLVLRAVGDVGDEYKVEIFKTYERSPTASVYYGLAWSSFPEYL